MHLFADGITRHEAAWLLYFLISRKFTVLAAVQATIGNYRNWSRDVRIPPLPANVSEGITGRLPRPDATISMSASQTTKFALHRCAAPASPSLMHTGAAPALIVV